MQRLLKETDVPMEGTKMAAASKFQPLIDELVQSLKDKQQKETAQSDRLNQVTNAFRPTEDYLTQLGEELRNGVEQSLEIRSVGGWREASDQRFTRRYEVALRGSVCHVLVFTVQGKRIEFDGKYLDIDNHAALEEALGKLIVNALKQAIRNQPTPKPV
jgi:hypothetical protein